MKFRRRRLNKPTLYFYELTPLDGKVKVNLALCNDGRNTYQEFCATVDLTTLQIERLVVAARAALDEKIARLQVQRNRLG